MRRQERKIKDQNLIAEILQNAQVLRLAMCKDNTPYVVPLSYGYDNEFIYFHCAHKGQKIDFLRANAKVCFEIETGVAIKKHDTKPCAWGVTYQSIIGQGTAEELDLPDDKLKALACIMRHYSEASWTFSINEIKAVSVWKITLHELSGKQA